MRPSLFSGQQSSPNSGCAWPQGQPTVQRHLSQVEIKPHTELTSCSILQGAWGPGGHAVMPSGQRAGCPAFSPSPVTDLLCDLEPGTFVFYPGKQRKNGAGMGGSCVLKTERFVIRCSGARKLKEIRNGKGWNRGKFHLFPDCVLQPSLGMCHHPPLGGLVTQ